MSSPGIVVDLESPVPPFEQLRAQLSALILGGEMTAGYRLPTVRQLAGDLALAPGTVARAYRELEQAGVIETKGRRGTFVRALPDVPRPDVTLRLTELARAYVAEARRLGLSDEALTAAVRRELIGRATAG